MSTPQEQTDLFPGPPLPGETEPDDDNLPPAPIPSSFVGDPPKEPEPKFPDPDPDPEKAPPGVSPVPTREPVEPGPDVIDPGLEPLPP
jgi:hypothetical protein